MRPHNRKPADELARIMVDTSDEYFQYYVNSDHATESQLTGYIELEAEREEIRRDRIGLVNQRLPEVRSA